MLRKIIIAATSVAGFLSVLAGPVSAQTFPDRPVKIVVGYPAGNGVDVNMRTIAPYLEKYLKTTVIVENKPGAGGAVAWTNVAGSKPDGYTLGSINYPAVAGITATGGLPFDPLEKLTFLGNFIYEPNIIAVSKNSPYKTLKDVITYLKANPSGLSYGSDGIASLDGLVALAVGKAAGVKFRSVNFGGGADPITSLLGGHIDAMGLGVTGSAPLLKNGDIIALGIGGNERNPLLPDIPTFAEQGYPLDVNASSRGLMMPAGADPAVVAKLREAVKAAAADPDYIATAKKMSQATRYIPPEQVKSDIAKQIEFVKTVVPPKSN